MKFHRVLTFKVDSCLVLWKFQNSQKLCVHFLTSSKELNSQLVDAILFVFINVFLVVMHFHFFQLRIVWHDMIQEHKIQFKLLN